MRIPMKLHPVEPETDVDSEARAKEIFELFRSSVEDEF